MGMMISFILCIVMTLSTVSCDLFKVLNNVNIMRQIPQNDKRHFSNEMPVRDNGFSWSSCGSKSDLIQLQSLSLSPDPLAIPGNVTVTAKGSVNADIQSPIKVDLEIEKKVFIWIKVPCIDNVGSCQYDDLCQLVTKFKCPPEFKKYKLPCQCPIKKGSYNLPATSIAVDPAGIPKWAESGEYRATVKASYNNKEILCLNLEFSLK